MKPLLEIQKDVPLAPLTTLKIGGNARFFVVAQDETQVAEAFAFAEKESLDIFVLGGGSNVLISDTGFDGLVIHIGLRGVVSEPPAVEAGNIKLLTAQAGEDWDNFVAYCVEHDLAGVECLSGIPGFVGGTPVQNVGAYGQEVSETIVSVRCFDQKTKEFGTLTNADCGFAYRTSIFNSTDRDRYIVLSVTFALRHGGEPKIAYKDLKEHFGETRPSLGKVRDAVLQIRRSKSMVINPDDPNSKSAGSFFKNPVVEKSKLRELLALNENVPSFAFGNKVKIPAAWLIENAGFHKGFAIGNAGISSKHTLALINRGNASAEELVLLKNEIQEMVESKFGIALQPEPVFVGFI
ncbi:MAG: UDP-N-acetylmuramate dehydrogenase [Chloracidobacterium sp.]|nr:UDP-N-acetylmuramate dehydrogenase [Chloracidobacterium sp.]